MDKSKLNTMKETVGYYRLILRILKTNPSEKYSLTDEDKKLLVDDRMYNQFQVDSIAMSVLIATQNKLNKKPNEKNFEKLFSLEYSASNDINDKIKQVRNCFAHAKINISENVIYFDNGKIKGSIRLDQLIFLPLLYNVDCFEVGTQKIGILAGGIVKDKIKDDNDLQSIIAKGKYTKFGIKSKEENFNKTMDIFKMIMSKVDYENMSPSQITKVLKNVLPNYNNYRIKSLSEYSELIQSYVDYIGRENFYKSQFMLQQDIISDVINNEENSIESHVERLHVISNLLPHFLKKVAENNQTELDFDALSQEKNILNLIITPYKFPLLYEDTMYSYIYSRFVYLRELINTNQIDESMLNYEDIDISDLQPQYFYSKKEVLKRKSEIASKMDNINKSIEELERQKNKLEVKLAKSNNPKNPNKDRDEKNYKEKIKNKQKLIDDYMKNIERLREELEYIKKNNKIPPTSSMLFRMMRNSSAHSFNIISYSKIKAYKEHDLGQLIFEFKDYENGKKKSSLLISATGLEKLIDNIEQSIMKNIGLIHAGSDVLESAVEATEEKATDNQMYESGKKVVYIQENRNINELNTGESEVSN